ncbi:twin-arginine translocation signal domain-containing protein [Svornostia abyssi]|uniref:Twin-arginine translocation signal domain-containing protein n=1 Tax=Svornostia abyssi TaxID=2898438 RepID=A0ABY5PAX3_9ACTN|nr:twin-arginine translocation signal domain-containing protein [Parviterribacteraceae bacterium J379]
MSVPMDRRTFLRSTAATAAAGIAAGHLPPPALAAGRLRVVLLGTLAGDGLGGAGNERTGTAIAVEHGGDVVLVGCGFGSIRRLLEAGIETSRLRAALVTRLTFDQTADLASLAMGAWSNGSNNGDPASPAARRRLPILGPAGTQAHLLAYARQEALTIDDQYRVLKQVPAFDVFARPRDVTASAVRRRVLRDGTVEVAAARLVDPRSVSSGVVVPEALGYRIAAGSSAVAIIGPCAHRDRAVALARGADTVVCEVVDVEGARRAARALGSSRAQIAAMQRTWTTPAEAADLAARAGAGTLVLAGLVAGRRAGHRPPLAPRYRRLHRTRHRGPGSSPRLNVAAAWPPPVR